MVSMVRLRFVSVAQRECRLHRATRDEIVSVGLPLPFGLVNAGLADPQIEVVATRKIAVRFHRFTQACVIFRVCLV